MLETILFYCISAVVIAAAIGVVVSRSAIYSVLFLVTAMCMMAGLFVLLKAFLVATVLVLVYAGAILVLFLFVVMMLDFKKVSPGWQGLKLSPVLAFILCGLLLAQFFRVISQTTVASVPVVQGNIREIGILLFEKYLVPFELTSFLILAAVVSVVVLAKKDTGTSQ